MIYGVLGFSFERFLDFLVKRWSGLKFRTRENQKIENLTFLGLGIYILHL